MTVPPVSLADWLTAALDAQATVAEACKIRSWRLGSVRGAWGSAAESEAGVRVVTAAEYALPHVIRHDPAFVLADIAAKRAIIDLHRAGHQNSDGWCPECDTPWPCETLRLLAQPYKDRHPGWRDGWDAT